MPNSTQNDAAANRAPAPASATRSDGEFVAFRMRTALSFAGMVVYYGR
jgi:hypothetical protein